MFGELKIRGVKVGHAQNEGARTGCTVILCEGGATVGVDVRGAAPGTRETDLCRPGNLVEQAHAVLLTGGSAFGLAAADGVMAYLEERGIGFDTGVAKVPIVPAAVLFDLGVGDPRVRPDAAMGRQACEQATEGPVAMGQVGAGTGATVGKALGPQFASPGGVGLASIELPGGLVIAAVVATNAVGDIYDGETIIAGAQAAGQFLDAATKALGEPSQGPLPGANTTIGCLITNGRLDKAQVNRLATVGHDGLARAIRPVHTPFDGDTLFALATGEVPAEHPGLWVAASEVVRRAVIQAVSAGGSQA